MANTRISLVIPTYKREELLVQTLKCALQQSHPEYEIILVDQTPDHTDETLRFLDENKDRINIIHSDTPSVTIARNIGTRAASGEIVVFIDDDTSFDEDFLKKHEVALSGDCDFVQGRVIEKGCKIYKKPVWLSFAGNFSGSDFCITDGKTNNITGCNFSFKKVLFDELAGFDEAFQGIAVCEDTDFAYRAYKLGFEGCFSSDAFLYHHRSDSGGVGHGVSNQDFDLGYYRNKLYFYKKNFPYPVYIYQWFKFLSKGLRRFYRLYRLATSEANRLQKNSK
ncbi:MAG: glycosyltransferase [Proteobacteria bacterium]|jgi:glycosyltransferase involved in cell wall biosynthesis|nr:glycosyltransferase [Pseudomonadota bacterium]MCG6935600.1 glycosyltransferase [Pseudomonadota bacterium]